MSLLRAVWRRAPGAAASAQPRAQSPQEAEEAAAAAEGVQHRRQPGVGDSQEGARGAGQAGVEHQARGGLGGQGQFLIYQPYKASTHMGCCWIIVTLREAFNNKHN